MPRLLSWPAGLKWNRMTALSGPEFVGSSESTSIGNMTQTNASPKGAIYIQITFPPMHGVLARRARGLVTALHRGANAVRVHMCDWDGLGFGESRLTVSQTQKNHGEPWSTGQPWDNGENWAIGRPPVPVVSSALRDATFIRIGAPYWGWQLGMGDWIGFFPEHFGRYEITEVLGDGNYRIWPPLRKALGPGDYATLHPTLAMRFLSSNMPQAERGPERLEGLTMSLFEVFDYDVKEYFVD